VKASAARQNASFGVAVSAKALDSEKHTPFKVEIFFLPKYLKFPGAK